MDKSIPPGTKEEFCKVFSVECGDLHLKLVMKKSGEGKVDRQNKTEIDRNDEVWWDWKGKKTDDNDTEEETILDKSYTILVMEGKVEKQTEEEEKEHSECLQM